MSLDEKDVDLNSFSKKLGDSFKKWGFCGVKNHGIDTELGNDEKHYILPEPGMSFIASLQASL